MNRVAGRIVDSSSCIKVDSVQKILDLTHLASWRAWFFQALTAHVDLKGRPVLEIGAGGCAVAKLVADRLGPDVVYSHNVFDHIDGLEKACKAMPRIA